MLVFFVLFPAHCAFSKLLTFSAFFALVLTFKCGDIKNGDGKCGGGKFDKQIRDEEYDKCGDGKYDKQA